MVVLCHEPDHLLCYSYLLAVRVLFFTAFQEIMGSWSIPAHGGQGLTEGEVVWHCAVPAVVELDLSPNRNGPAANVA